jgi:threonine aldolase
MESVAAIARRNHLSFHLDGARIFNAAISLRVGVKELTRSADSVMFCLSKGLAAPVGSLVAGSEPFIQRARKMRKMVGGGMRQVGILAAAGIVALREMVDRLVEDHDTARLLAKGLAEVRGIEIDLARVETNIVIFSLVAEDITPGELVLALQERGVRLLAIGGNRLRAVTHYGISEEDIKVALEAFREVLG